jgi:hypothetical protein
MVAAIWNCQKRSAQSRPRKPPTVEELRSDREERRREDGTGNSFYTEDINF